MVEAEGTFDGHGEVLYSGVRPHVRELPYQIDYRYVGRVQGPVHGPTTHELQGAAAAAVCAMMPYARILPQGDAEPCRPKVGQELCSSGGFRLMHQYA